jgi:hypothetical protein
MATTFHQMGRLRVHYSRTRTRGSLGQFLISIDCVFDASLVPETYLEFPP